MTIGYLLSLGWAAPAAAHVHLLFRSRFLGRTKLFCQPNFNVSWTEPQQSPKLDASRQVAAVRMAVIDCLLGKTECGCKSLWSEKVFHRVT